MTDSTTQGLDLGLEEMERQHGELHAILDTLHSRVGEPRPAADLERLIQLFQEHLEGHFRSEEALMRRFAYDDGAYNLHRAEHREILAKVRELLPLLRREETGGGELTAAIEREVIGGLERHMQWDDAVIASLRGAAST